MPAMAAALLIPCTTAVAGFPFIFSSNSTIDVGAGVTPLDVAAGDFNHDYRTDFVVAGSGESRGFVLVLGQSGTPQFSRPAVVMVDANAPADRGGQSVIVADFNNDGDQDVALSRKQAGVTISPGNGDGTFAAPVAVLDDVTDGQLVWPLRLTTFHLDVDNDLDLVLTDGRNGTIYVLRNDGNFNFTLIQEYPIAGVTQLTAGDLDGDGLDDLAWAKSNDGAVVAMNDGNGGFDTPVTHPLSQGVPYDIEVVDIDLDGDRDLVVTHSDSPEGWISVMSNDGDGQSFDVSHHNIPIIGPTELTQGDFDGDLRMDLAVLDFGGQIWFIRNETVKTGEFEFAFPFHVSTGSGSSRRLITANYDGDCDHDVISIKVGPSSISLFTNNSPQLSQCTVADFDFDGLIDGDDLSYLLGEWGKVGSPADLDMNGRVDGWDLAVLLWAWQQEVPTP